MLPSGWLPRAGAVTMLRMDLSPSHCPRHLAGAASLESSLLPGSDVPILYAKKKEASALHLLMQPFSLFVLRLHNVGFVSLLA